MKRKPIVGETLYSLNVGNACSKYNPAKLTEVIVTKVGRKFFSAKEKDSPREERFYVEDWKHECGGYSPRACLYEDPKEWEDEIEAGDLCEKIYRAFEYRRNTKNISLPNLRIIVGVLNNPQFEHRCNAVLP